MSKTVTIPEDLEQELRRQAARARTTMDEVVRRALEWYVRSDLELLDELDAWQEVRDEALGTADWPGERVRRRSPVQP